MTVAELLEDFMKRRRQAGRKDTTLTNYQRVIENHLVPHLGSHRLTHLRPDHIEAMLHVIRSSPSLKSRRLRNSGAPGAGTLVNIRAVLRAALNDAVRRQLVPRNVAALVELPTPRRRAPIALDDARLKLFLTTAADHPLEILWALVAVYGLRRGEIAGLRWDEIDESQRLIVVRTTVLDVDGIHPCPYCDRGHRRIKFDTTKTPAGERVYPLVPVATAALQEQRRRQGHDKDLYGTDYADHGLVFAQPDGDPWRPEWISNQFHQVMKASGAADGLESIPSLKALRSTMVTNLHEAGTPIEVISRITGHSGGEVTRNHYLKIAAERTRREFTDVSERFGTRWSGRSDRQSDQPGAEPEGREEG